MEDVNWLAYSKMTLKSDEEPAILKLLGKALRELRIHGVAEWLA